MFDPCTVIDPEPVPALLRTRTWLDRIKSTDHDSLVLPSLLPTVTMARWVPLDPCATRQLIVVSEHHTVPSHPVCAFLALIENMV
jgi:hypothetical protein